MLIFVISCLNAGGDNMNNPVLIESETICEAWSQAIFSLVENKWELWDLIVRINNPICFDERLHNRLTEFARKHGLIEPTKVCYTIFPYKLTRAGHSFESICRAYLTKYFPMTRKMEHAGWGTYFHRMIAYPSVKDSRMCSINQLGKIISAIKGSNRILRAAYTIVIPVPGGENVKPLGTPCLNSIAIRQEPKDDSKMVSMLAIYRNHDFSERAYGNYFGLAKLLEYISKETNSICGSLTCISSHAFLNNSASEVKKDLCLIAEGQECN